MRYINDVIDISAFKNSKGQTVKQALLEQARYLKQLIEDNIKAYRNSYTPFQYRRTGQLENSLSVSADIKFNKGVYTAYVYFNENALHRSGFGVWAIKKFRGAYDDDIRAFNNPLSVNTAYLINYGYTVKKPVWFADIENFGKREGEYFVELAIDEFNKTNSMGIYIDKTSDIITVREW